MEEDQDQFYLSQDEDGIEPAELPEVTQEEESDFYENLAKDSNFIDSSQLNVLASQLIGEIETDEQSRSEWERVGRVGLTYLGYSVEEQKSGTPLADIKLSSVYDSSLSICWIRFCATARAELLPAAGPCKIEIIGDPSEEVEQKAERVKVFSNHYLTNIDEDYYPDTEKLLAYVGLWGSAFKKVYQDPFDKMPKARFIKPHDIIVNVNTTSLLSSDRITHRMEMSRRDIEALEENNEYLPSNLPEVSTDNDGSGGSQSVSNVVNKIDGIKKGVSENKSLFTYYEVHGYFESDKLDRKFKGGKKPYVVTICKDTKKVVCVKRNWEEGDNKFKRKECFLHYYYLPGFGLYGLGQAHLCVSNSVGATTLIRQSIDLCSFKNFPAGLKKKSVRSEQNNLALLPGEFKDVDTDENLTESIMPMPYPDLSPQVMSLKENLSSQNMAICGVAESKIPELGMNTPVGTTLAVLEVEKQVISTVLRFLHNTLKREFKLLFKLFSKCLPDAPYVFSVPGGASSIMRDDFSDDIHIVPVSDVNSLTSTHRMIYAEALLKLAQSNPGIHNIHEIYRRLYSAMNVPDIDKILVKEPDPSSLDPLSEVTLAMKGKPIKAVFAQDHQAHVLIKKNYLQNPLIQSNIPAYLVIQANIQHHKCYIALDQVIAQKMQELASGHLLQPMGHKVLEGQINQFRQMDVEEIQKIPEVQNLVAKMDAEETQQGIIAQQQQMQEAKEAQQKQVDPNFVMLSEIQQKREEAQLRDKASDLKAEVESFKTQMKYETDMAKMEMEKELAEEKNERDLKLQTMKQQTDRDKMDVQERIFDKKIASEKESVNDHF